MAILNNITKRNTGEVILVVDDVTTSGNSLYACRDILLKNGASRVALLALGQTVS